MNAGMETKLYLATFRINDEVGYFNAALGLGRKRPPGIKLRQWYITAGGETCYSIWEAGDPHALMGVLDVEFAGCATYEIEEVNLLYGQ